jgi:hypothetical protein
LVREGSSQLKSKCSPNGLLNFQESSNEERVKAMSTATAAANGWAKSTKVKGGAKKTYILKVLFS